MHDCVIKIDLLIEYLLVDWVLICWPKVDLLIGRRFVDCVWTCRLCVDLLTWFVFRKLISCIETIRMSNYTCFILAMIRFLWCLIDSDVIRELKFLPRKLFMHDWVRIEFGSSLSSKWWVYVEDLVNMRTDSDQRVTVDRTMFKNRTTCYGYLMSKIKYGLSPNQK